jgi:hypothetical protein
MSSIRNRRKPAGVHAPERRSPRSRALRFGIGALVVLALIGLWLWRRKHHPWAGGGVASLGLLLAIGGLAAPAATLAVRAAWMRLAAALGWVNSRILLGVLFFLVLTPIAFVRRLAGGALRFTPADRTRSHWRPRDPRDRTHWEHPY